MAGHRRPVSALGAHCQAQFERASARMPHSPLDVHTRQVLAAWVPHTVRNFMGFPFAGGLHIDLSSKAGHWSSVCRSWTSKASLLLELQKTTAPSRPVWPRGPWKLTAATLAARAKGRCLNQKLPMHLALWSRPSSQT